MYRLNAQMEECSVDYLILFLRQCLPCRQHLQNALNLGPQKLHAAIVPPTHVLELQASLENSSLQSNTNVDSKL